MSNLSHCLHAFVTEIINGDVKHAVVCPGSRNFPLIKTLVAADKFVQLHSCVDERSAGFVALGLAQSSNSTVVLCCTSGTAALNFYPAIAEAFYSRTPLLILTADRPPEAIDNWEGQTIRQKHVYNQHSVASFETPVEVDRAAPFKSIAQDAMNKASEENGPVHVNMPFKEPFYTDWNLAPFQKQGVTDVTQKTSSVPEALVKSIQSSEQILWLNGASTLKETYNYPSNLLVFSDVISNKNQSTSLWENIINRHKQLSSPAYPHLIITTGKYFVSKQLRSFLKSNNNIEHWHIGTDESIPTPFHTNPILANCKVSEVLHLIEKLYVNESYKAYFDGLNLQLKQNLDRLAWTGLNEFGVIKDVYNRIPASSVIHISNSMPIRYVGLLERRNDLVHFANRGTSGIDGCTSTAVGYAKGCDELVYLLTGDLAFLYDINGLWQDVIPNNLRIVVLNNNGGGIFELIDGPNQHPSTQPYQTTEHTKNMDRLADHFNIEYIKVSTDDAFENAISTFMAATKPVILEVQTERQLNKAFFESYKTTVINALRHDE